MSAPPGAAVDLYWIPLGAGGRSVRFNGQLFEAVLAAREHRRRCDLAAWLIAAAGLDADELQPPPRGRAPGWSAGLVVARRTRTAVRAG